MATKTIITFLDQPEVSSGIGTIGFQLGATVNGIPLQWSGKTEMLILYIPENETPNAPFFVPLGATLEETINKTLYILQTNFVQANTFYQIVGNTIEIGINENCVVSLGNTNANITSATNDITPPLTAEKYHLAYKDWDIKIYQKGYVGVVTEIYGKFKFKKGDCENILDPIKGTGMSLELEASLTNTFEDLSLSVEGEFTVKVYKGGAIFYNGFLKPDGIYQSFVSDLWFINLDFVDGLGTLKDLMFVDSAGFPFIGKMSIYDVIKNALARTRMTMNINSSVELSYDGYTGTNILKDTYVNADRYTDEKDGENVTMDCDEVLKSVLTLFSGVVTQERGEWYVYRPNDIKDITEFTNNTTDVKFNKNLYLKLGSQIDNFYPHHCSGNQQIMLKGAISAYRLEYKYGKLKSSLINSSFKHDLAWNYQGWTAQHPEFDRAIIKDPTDSEGLKMLANNDNRAIVKYFEKIPLAKGEKFNLNIIMTAYSRVRFHFMVRGLYSDGRYFHLTNNGTWTGPETQFYYQFGGKDPNLKETWTADIQSEPFGEPLELEIIIYTPVRKRYVTQPGFNYQCELVEFNYVPINQDSDKTSEYWTARRENSPSSIVKLNQTVNNGDNKSSIYIGALYKSDKITLTSLWNRNGILETKPLLRISVEDDMRLQQNTIQEFSGDALGYINFLSLVEINNVVGKFQFTEWEYDCYTEILTYKLTQFFNDEIPTMTVEPTYGYGNTVKPKIKG